uniref:Protein regulator of cytokinesis 1 n=1 Tax=Phallusia mammillata TaxID=59560 RepID=A0A6F9DPR8_9ASCI|nr:protein regulator of cytokinesis 1 [Phallusia mammillata]
MLLISMSRRTQPVEISIQNIIRMYLNRLEVVWNELGISEQQVSKRSDTVCEHITDLMENMLNEEERLMQTVRENSVRFHEEITILRKELGLSPESNETSVLLDSSSSSIAGMPPGSLYLKERKARKEVLRLHELEKTKKQALETLLSEEIRCNSQLDSAPLLQSTPMFKKAVLVEKIEMMHERNRKLHEKYKKRLGEFAELRSNIRQKLQEIEFAPNDFISSVLENDVPTFSLSEENLQQIRDFDNTIEMQNLVSIARQTVCDIEDLWIKLDVGVRETTPFRREFFGFVDVISEENLQRLKSEKTRLLTVWKANISDLTTRANETLQNMLRDGFLLEPKEDNSTEKYQEDREEVLRQLEAKIENTRIQLKDRDQVVRKLQVWKKAFDRITELEAKTHDPDRLRNRGGKLLAEEKERKQLKKQIVKMERSVYDAAETWLQNHLPSSGEFLANGLPLNEYFSSQRKELESLKDFYQNRRHIKRKREIEEDIRYGSSNPQKCAKGNSKRVKCDLKSTSDDSNVSCKSDKSSVGGYLTAWGEIRFSPIKSTVTSRFGTFPGRRASKKTEKLQVPKTTDFIDTRRNLATQTFKQKKLRRRSKSVDNLTSLGQRQEPQGKFKLPLPSGSAYHNPKTTRSLKNNQKIPKICENQENESEHLSNVSRWNTTELPNFSETLRNQPYDRELDIQPLGGHDFERGLLAIVKEEPYTRSSAIGLPR